MNDGYSRLAGAIKNRAQAEAAQPPVVELGYIQADGLKTDHFDRVIPNGAYLRCSGVTIEIGDRVLVAWVGPDAIIIDVVVT